MTFANVTRVVDIFDRHPTRVNLLYIAGAVATHGPTTRFTYTIPAGRIAIIETLFMSYVRIAIAGNGFVAMEISWGNPASAKYRMFTEGNVYGAGTIPSSFWLNTMAITQCGILWAGDIITAVTQLANPGDTVTLQQIVGLITFDA